MVQWNNDMTGFNDPSQPVKPQATFGGVVPPPVGFNANQPIAPPTSLGQEIRQNPSGLGPLQPAQPSGGGVPPGITPILPPPPMPGNGQPSSTGNVGGTTQFGPGNNLIGTQINPGDPTDTAGARKQLGDLLTGIGGAMPDRKALALDNLKTFDQNQADESNLGVRDIGRYNAAAGRLGSGMVSTDLGDLQTRLNQERDQYTRGLNNDVTSQTLNDRLSALGATGAGLGTLSNLDQNSRNELRGERDYQSGQNQQNVNNNIAQKELENQTQGQDFNQKLAQLGLLNEGFSSSPTGTALANYYNTQGGDINSAIAQLLYGLGQSQVKKAA